MAEDTEKKTATSGRSAPRAPRGRRGGRREKKVQTRDSVSEDTRLREILRSLPEHGRQAVKALQELQEEEGGEGEEGEGQGAEEIYGDLEEKDPTELTMEEALILIEKRKEYDKSKKRKKIKKRKKVKK